MTEEDTYSNWLPFITEKERLDAMPWLERWAIAFGELLTPEFDSNAGGVPFELFPTEVGYVWVSPFDKFNHTYAGKVWIRFKLERRCLCVKDPSV